MKKLFIPLLFVAVIASAINGYTRVPVSNTLSDFFVQLQARFISLYTDTQDVQVIRRIVKFGRNEDVDNTSNEDVWAWGGSASGDVQMVYSTSAEPLSIVSTAVTDATTSTGARSLLITCVQEDGTETDVSVIMNGATGTETTTHCEFVNRAALTESGSNQKNAGDISITGASTSRMYAWIATGDSVTHQIPFKVPSDERCFINDLYMAAEKISGGANPRVVFFIKVFNSTTNTEYIIRRELLDTSTISSRHYPDFKDQALLPGEIINIEVDTDTDNTEVEATLDLTCRKI